jgi:hypothetical protein
MYTTLHGAYVTQDGYILCSLCGRNRMLYIIQMCFRLQSVIYTNLMVLIEGHQRFGNWRLQSGLH